MAVSNKSDIVRPTKRSQVAKLDSFPQRILESLAGRSMRWLSEETGISTSMLSEYGKGKTPGADKALAIANALGVDLRWLLTGRGNRLGPDADNNFDNDMVALDQVEDAGRVGPRRGGARSHGGLGRSVDARGDVAR